MGNTSNKDSDEPVLFDSAFKELRGRLFESFSISDDISKSENVNTIYEDQLDSSENDILGGKNFVLSNSFEIINGPEILTNGSPLRGCNLQSKHESAYARGCDLDNDWDDSYEVPTFDVPSARRNHFQPTFNSKRNYSYSSHYSSGGDGTRHHSDENVNNERNRGSFQRGCNCQCRQSMSCECPRQRGPTKCSFPGRFCDCCDHCIERRVEWSFEEVQEASGTPWMLKILRNSELRESHDDLVSYQMRNDSSKPSSHDLDHYKRVFARQRAKDLADHAQKLLAKDKEISDLRQAVDRLQNSSRQPDPNVRNSKMYSEKDELERIVRQHAKEQLRLQRCLSAASAHDPSGNTIGYQALEETNKALRKELNDFEQSNIQAQQLEAEVAQQRLECDNLQKEIENEHKRSSVLTSELQDALVENTNLTRQNTQLQERLTKLETFEEECKRLSEALKQQQSLFEASVDEKNNLKQTVAKLEKEVKLMQAAAEKRKQLEKEHEEAILSLQFKQDEIRNLQKEQQQSKREHHDSVSKLEDKVKDLEKRYEEQSANVGKLTQELQNLRKVTNKTMEEIAVQTQEKELNKSNEVARAFATKVSTAPNQSKDWLDDYEVIMVNEYAFVSLNGTPLALRDLEMSGENLEEVFQLPESKTKEDSGSIGTDVSSYCEKIRRLTLSDSEDDWGIGLGEALTKQSKIAVNGSLSDHALEDGLIGDRIMALADSNSDISLSQVEAFTDASEGETASLQQMSSQSKDDGLQGLEAQYYEALLNASSEEDGLIESLSNGLKAQAARSVETEKSEHFSQLSSSEAMSDEVFRNSEDLSKSGSLPSDNQARRVSSRKSKDSDEVDVSMLQRLQSASVNKLAVFIARYNYTPSSDSPNENPDAELPLKAGEYIYVYGDADEDGFYEGELMSGERGLVPGNFIERIADAKDLLDNPDGAVPMLMHTNHSHGSEDPMLEFQGIVHDSLSDSLNSDEDGARDDDFDRDSLMSYHVTMEKDSLSSFSHIASRESLKGFIFS
ncbi:RIMS-binding protein 3-like isoform X6 [Anneissia japonica]|uniref:RIMS-binding protein 3-like isoform X6 n=1 Tax=Anneissia japonica TaxID=1529436 RepID=UPI0014255EB0|nr:RIMS-binding protein 3-like isoform X6 [Anneissia japonica]